MSFNLAPYESDPRFVSLIAQFRKDVPDPWLTDPQLKDLDGLSEVQRWRLRRAGKYPPAVKVAKRNLTMRDSYLALICRKIEAAERETAERVTALSARRPRRSRTIPQVAAGTTSG